MNTLNLGTNLNPNGNLNPSSNLSVTLILTLNLMVTLTLSLPFIQEDKETKKSSVKGTFFLNVVLIHSLNAFQNVSIT